MLDWITALTAHSPNQGQHLVHYYGWYSNAGREKVGNAREAALQGTVEIPPPSISPALKQHWAQLIKKAPACRLPAGRRQA